MRKLTLSIVGATLATAGVAFAAPGSAPTKAPRADMTRAQVEASAAKRFAKMDANSDGKLDAADRAARQAKAFDRIDADRNGAISRDEFTAKRAGRGGGGHAGMAGMEHGQASAEHRTGGQRMGGHGKRGRGGPGGFGGGRMMMAKMADANGDGAITQAEFSAAALKRFDTVDTDRNGTLTAAERQAARAAMKAKWEARKAARQAN